MSLLQKILNRQRGPLPVPTPEWPELDGQLFIRPLTPPERLAFYDVANQENPARGIEFQALMACYAACKADGTRAFDDGDWKQLAGDANSGPAIERLADAADGLHVLSDGAREAIKKKSASTSDCGSSSASPGPSVSA